MITRCNLPDEIVLPSGRWALSGGRYKPLVRMRFTSEGEEVVAAEKQEITFKDSL